MDLYENIKMLCNKARFDENIWKEPILISSETLSKLFLSQKLHRRKFPDARFSTHNIYPNSLSTLHLSESFTHSLEFALINLDSHTDALLGKFC